MGGGQQGVVAEGDVPRVGAHHHRLAGTELSPLVRAAKLVSVGHPLKQL